MTMRRIATKLLMPALLALGATGCAAYRLEPPAGFAEVEQDDDYGAHMKANNDVGLRVHVFHNVRGGSLAFWSRDLVEKLGSRGYTLQGQSPTESKNGVVGTRFDFAYTPVGTEEAARFYTVALFVTDEHRVVLGVAGREEYRSQYSAEVDTIVADLKVRGCKIASKICKGPQPDRLATAAPPTNEGPGPDEAEPDDKKDAEAEPDDKKDAEAEAEPEKKKKDAKATG